MEKNSFEKANSIGKPRILIAPMDWGLGHATRCIPIIYCLIDQGYRVFMAAEGASAKLLRQEFPDIECLPLKGYRIRYGKNRIALRLKVLAQIPGMVKTISNEHKWLEKTIQEKQIDIVISDNRFGLYNKNVYCIFLTHQLFIKSFLFETLLQQMNYRFINKFNECWVPDFSDEPNLAGLLSHPKRMPSILVKYIGWLTRFTRPIKTQPKHLLILLSGPEPQRTILENMMLEQLTFFQEAVFIVRGLPGDKKGLELPANIKYANHLPAKQLQEAIDNSFLIIARAGYSTIMDLLKLHKKTVLIPTPGQTEQEYLARHLLDKKLAFSVKQENFNLKQALADAQTFQYSFLNKDATPLLQEALAFKNFYKNP